MTTKEQAPGFSSIYEWIDYWQSGHEQWKKDGFEMSRNTRDELGWASQTINHMLASLHQIAELDYSRAAINGAAYDAVKIAGNALAEYGQKAGAGDVHNGQVVSLSDRSPLPADSSRWIQVTERLPDNNRDVLVWHSENGARTGHYGDHYKSWFVDDDCPDIRHWMELPDSPLRGATP